MSATTAASGTGEAGLSAGARRASILTLLAGAAILLTGNGVLGTLIPVRGAAEGYGAEFAALTGSAYFFGLILGCLGCSRVIARVGHIRAYAAFAACVSALTLALALEVELWLWCALRLVSGIAFAGLFMVLESWLNEAATNAIRGRVVSIYMVVVYAAVGGGQFLLMLYPPSGFQLFSVIAMLLALSLLPVVLTSAPAPIAPEPEILGVRRLFAISPVGVMGCFASGVALGAFYTLAPLFAAQTPGGADAVAPLMGVTILGGLLLQWPLGLLSDRYDRRSVMLGVCAMLALSSVSIMLAEGVGTGWLLVACGLFGGLVFAVYPLGLAHANDHMSPRDLVPASSGLLLAYSLGAVLGPLPAGVAMEMAGARWLWAFEGGVAVLLALFIGYRMRQRPALPAEEQAPFMVAPLATPAAPELDPRVEMPEVEIPESENTESENPESEAEVEVAQAELPESGRPEAAAVPTAAAMGAQAMAEPAAGDSQVEILPPGDAPPPHWRRSPATEPEELLSDLSDVPSEPPRGPVGTEFHPRDEGDRGPAGRG